MGIQNAKPEQPLDDQCSPRTPVLRLPLKDKRVHISYAFPEYFTSSYVALNRFTKRERIADSERSLRCVSNRHMACSGSCACDSSRSPVVKDRISYCGA